MFLLFVSSTVTGGSGKSQRQLASRLATQGHDVRFLVDAHTSSTFVRTFYEKLTDLEVKTARTPLAPIVGRIARLPGRRARQIEFEESGLQTSHAPENAIAALLDRDRPDVVVGSSIDRVTWRKVTSHCRTRGIPTVLYLREVAALGHLTISKLRPDLLVANAHSLAVAAARLGFQCEMVPSVVELHAVMTETTRRSVLIINPIESHGVALAFDLAARHPELPFVLQESWQLSAEQWQDLETRARPLRNVELRRRRDQAAAVYADARVLLVPHLIDNRPRVIAEAQVNGIPVLVSDQPGLAESVGPGGRVIPIANLDEWSDALISLWSGDAVLEDLARAAREHAARDQLDPAWVAARFAELVAGLIGSTSDTSS